MKTYTVAIIGAGSRGAFTYGKLMRDQGDEFKIVSLCDIKQSALDLYAEEFGIDKSMCFLSEDDFLKEKRADVLVVATQDRDHVRMAIKALELGYDILLEKPISPVKKELLDLLKVQKRTGGKVLVCHVLRYAPAYLKMKELIDNGEIGKIVKTESIERVAYWHESHSFVRGNWHVEKDTSPMILAKCCHDLDIIQWLVGSKCKSVYSTGGLVFFKKENQPEGASNTCKDCKYKQTCPYSAELQYAVRFKEQDNKQGWPFNVLVPDKVPFTQEDVRKAYEESYYGHCVFDCNNDVVDHQQVEMIFENGVKASHTMTAFTAPSGRRFDVHGTYGEIMFDEDQNFIRLYKYNGLSKPEIKEWKLNELIGEFSETKGFGHGGGDAMMIKKFYSILEGEVEGDTSLDKSIESHLIGLAAEESRKKNKVIKM